MKIGIDIDDVLINTTEAVLDEHYRRTGEWLSLSDIKSYNLSEWVSSEYADSIWWCFNGIWDNIKLIDNAVDSIKNISKEHKIIFVTATKNERNLKIKTDLIRRYFGEDIEIISTQNKQEVDIDILIDDYEKNLINAKYIGLLFDYEWNRGFDECNHHIYRVDNWNEIVEYVRFINDNYDKLI